MQGRIKPFLTEIPLSWPNKSKVSRSRKKKFPKTRTPNTENNSFKSLEGGTVPLSLCHKKITSKNCPALRESESGTGTTWCK